MKNFMIVDDSAVVRKVARRILEKFDITISEAEDGREALAACGKEMPDGVIVDDLMPVMNGFEFLKSLRALPGGDAPKVIFLTSEHNVAQIARAKHAGANDFMLKPFDQDGLTDKLHEMGLL